MENLDILAFGAHADDVEIGMAGTISKFRQRGYKIGICDLTQAELSSNGSVSLRKQEAAAAATILGVEERINVYMQDRGLLLEEKKIKAIVSIIRKYKPKLVCAPYFEDRHPDHGNCAKLVEEAVFSAGIKRYEVEEGYDSHKVKHLYFYMINGFHKPDFVVDISDEIQIKLDSLRAYQSQFVKGENGIETPLTDGYIENVEARERLFGKEVGVAFAEGFKLKKPVLLHDDFI